MQFSFTNHHKWTKLSLCIISNFTSGHMYKTQATPVHYVICKCCVTDTIKYTGMMYDQLSINFIQALHEIYKSSSPETII
jgi:hypothetical protein